MRATGPTALYLLVAVGLMTAGSLVPAAAAASEADAAQACPDRVPVMEVTEQGRGRPLVMVGGILTGAAGLEQLAGQLEAERRIVRLQNLNVAAGAAGEPLPSRYGVRLESCALLAALDRAGITTPVDLVGYSYGGLIALDFALQHPERVRTLSVIEPPARWLLSNDELDGADQVRFRDAARATAVRIPDDAQLASFICVVFGCGGGGDELERARQLPLWPSAVRHRASLTAAAAVVEYRRQPDELSRLQIPILYVSGAGTSEFHARINRAFSRHAPHARTIELPGGHAAPNVSAPELAEAIRNFTS